MNSPRESNFDTDWHTLYCGWVIGLAKKHGLNVRPVVDDDGNYLPELELTLPHIGNTVEVRITLVIPPPPEDWEL